MSGATSSLKLDIGIVRTEYPLFTPTNLITFVATTLPPPPPLEFNFVFSNSLLHSHTTVTFSTMLVFCIYYIFATSQYRQYSIFYLPGYLHNIVISTIHFHFCSNCHSYSPPLTLPARSLLLYDTTARNSLTLPCCYYVYNSAGNYSIQIHILLFVKCYETILDVVAYVY